jgi:alpha-N-acetylglucosamine transferase
MDVGPNRFAGMAYVTVLSTDHYLPGALALNESLRRCKSKYSLYVLVGRKVSSTVLDTLAKANISTIQLPAVDIPEQIKVVNMASDHHQHWVGVFEKLCVFSLCQFNKVVFLDSDMLVIKNIDELFEKPHMSAVIADISPDTQDSVDLNAGLMVIEPASDLTDRLLATLPAVFEHEKRWRLAAGRPPSMGVQSVINLFWSEWIAQSDLHLDRKYNVITNHLDYYIRSLGYRWRGPDGIHVLHFIGQVKPWMRTGAHFLRWAARLLARGRLWELTATVAFLVVLRRARLHLNSPSLTAKVR